MAAQVHVSYNSKTTRSLVRAYNQAAADKAETFICPTSGEELQTTYAFYLVQHLIRDLGMGEPIINKRYVSIP
jgi:hypothetical protein